MKFFLKYSNNPAYFLCINRTTKCCMMSCLHTLYKPVYIFEKQNSIVGRLLIAFFFICFLETK